MRINKTKYPIKDENFTKKKTKKKQIIVGLSLRKGKNHITRLKHKEFGNTMSWNTFTITRDGKVYQHYNDDYYSNFLGDPIIDKSSISIILENMGSLNTVSDDIHVNWLNEVCDESNVIEKNWFGNNHWEEIPDKQLKSLVDLCGRLCNKHGIHKMFMEFQHHHEQTSRFKGVVFRGNYINDSGDMNPFLESKKLQEMISNII